MNFFLKIKTWQLFVLLILPHLLVSFFLNGSIDMRYLGGLSLFMMLVILGWLYSVGVAANRKLPIKLQKTFSIFLPSMLEQPQEPPAWFFIMHLAAMFGIFYGLWFTAKQFVTLQKNSEVGFSEYIRTLFLFWFSPIGVWFLQPKINKLLSDSSGAN